MMIRPRWVFLIAASFLLGGCMLFGLKEDVKKLKAATTISGMIVTSRQTKPVVVVLAKREGKGKHRPVAHAVMYGPGHFEFLRESGDYYLFAFEDANEDFTLQPAEYAGWGTASQLSSKRALASTLPISNWCFAHLNKSNKPCRLSTLLALSTRRLQMIKAN